MILLPLLVLPTAICMLMLIRNNQVYRYRSTLIDQISEAAKSDNLLLRDWMWRYDYFATVSYDKMVTQFWKPLDSFFPDKAFITPSKKESV